MFKKFIKVAVESYGNEEKNNPFDVQTVLVCLLGTLSLLFISYIAKTGKFIYLLWEFGLFKAANYFRAFFEPSENGNLVALIWFASFSFCFYLVFPLVIMRLFTKKHPSDFGLKLKGALLYGELYLIFMVIMVPAIIFAARLPGFQAMYPFYKAPLGQSVWPNILIWEIFYLLQFLGTEFFFRGFLIHGLKHRFGFYSIFISVIPYCMIHFQKPFMEAFLSIFAGIILGVMSLRTNSVIMGTALHFGVALTMDVSVLLFR